MVLILEGKLDIDGYFTEFANITPNLLLCLELNISGSQ